MADTAPIRAVPERIRRLRDELFATPTTVCWQRARIVTRSYRATEGEPWPIRRAKALAAIFDEMPIFIRSGELLVGQRAAVLGGKSVYPEFFLDGHAATDIPPEVAEYWRGKTLGDEARALHPDILRRAEHELAAGYCTGTATGYGHVIVDYEKALRVGFRGIVAEARAALDSAPAGDRDGRAFLEAVIIAADGIIRWAGRYADLAETEAAVVRDPFRVVELRRIAAICRRVPAGPARSFAEALQSFWFVHLAMHVEQYGWSISAGRFDKYMHPYYRADVDSGALSRESAWDLLLGLWVKFAENIGTRVRETIFQNLTLGGRDSAGRDESNELSHLCLDATVALGSIQPALSVRVHANTDPGFRAHVHRTIAHGLGQPALFNDEVVIPALVAHGVSPEDAASWGVVGCVELCAAGKQQGLTAGGHVNVAKALELAMNDGVSMLTGERLGPATGDPEKFAGFDDLWRAYTAQVEHLSALTVLAATVASAVQGRRGHCPLMSALLDDCIARRRDLVNGGTRYNLPGTCVFGNSNAYDGLAAIRRRVCDERRTTFAELRRAMREDFAGREPLRRLLADGPRFGNGIPEVDALANRVNAVHVEFLGRHSELRGGQFTCGVWPVEGHVGSGKWTAATPDGRHAGAPLADGVGACQGADRCGPTALLRSVAMLDHGAHWTAGNTCNVKFSRASVANRGGIERLEALTTGYFELGGMQLQINVVDAATLRAAQADPETYRDLVVRVAGFSAYFTMLSPDTQNEIISRTEQEV